MVELLFRQSFDHTQQDTDSEHKEIHNEQNITQHTYIHNMKR